MFINVPKKYLKILLRKIEYSSKQDGFSKKTKKRFTSAINQISKLLSENKELKQIQMSKNKLQTLGKLSEKTPVRRSGYYSY